MAFIRDLIDNEAEEHAKEQLEFLMSSARAKADAFENELNLQFLNPDAQNKIQIVGDRAFLYVKEYRANVTEGVSEEILKVVDQFFSGTSEGVKSGFQSLVDVAFKSLLGNATAGEYEQSSFFIVPENNALIRVDVKMWRYNFSSQDIVGKTSNALVVLFAKSVVDHTTLSVDELLYFLTETVGSTNKSEVIGLIADLKEMWALLAELPVTDTSARLSSFGSVSPTVIER